MPGHGASDGNFRSIAARCSPSCLLGHRLVCTGAAFGGNAEFGSGFGPIERSAEPFGLLASQLAGGGLREKWLGVQRRLDDERVQLALCEGDLDRCASPAALQFLAIVDTARARDGRARLGEINRAINLAIKPMGDFEQYGAIDVWSSPLSTLTRGRRLRRLRRSRNSSRCIRPASQPTICAS